MEEGTIFQQNQWEVSHKSGFYFGGSYCNNHKHYYFQVFLAYAMKRYGGVKLINNLKIGAVALEKLLPLLSLLPFITI